ncbi:hypothetical protein NQD34_012545 [Periophthalmus magnuspinnatus]|nr:hypothetical protein NQD34_012545 [Periophthalmus magnuspinnatus]
MEEDGLSVSCGNGKLRQWLIDQIDSGRYPGLVWENDEKSIFRIPWKHAGKQDYNREEDAALFKAWALFKGKYKEGVDKPDPPTWKTRLRCALNKSNDFDELVERSQLDISEPYKVYRIIPEGAKKGMKMSSVEESSHLGFFPSYSSLQNQVPGYTERRDWRDFASSDQQPLPPPPFPPHHHHELQYHYPSALGRPWPTPHSENGFQLSFHTYLSESQPPVYAMDPNAVTDFSLHVSFLPRVSGERSDHDQPRRMPHLVFGLLLFLLPVLLPSSGRPRLRGSGGHPVPVPVPGVPQAGGGHAP